MTDKTLYDILEVSPGASPEMIRVAYELLSKKYDPGSAAGQANPDAEVKYNALKEAFLTIGDPQKRAEYDKNREARERLALQNVKIVEPFWTMPKLIVLALVVVFGGGYYYKQKQTEVRLAAGKAAAGAKAREADEKARAEAEQAQPALQQQPQERSTEERARREGEQSPRPVSAEQPAPVGSTERPAVR